MFCKKSRIDAAMTCLDDTKSSSSSSRILFVIVSSESL